jgi:hypothetical protein
MGVCSDIIAAGGSWMERVLPSWLRRIVLISADGKPVFFPRIRYTDRSVQNPPPKREFTEEQIALLARVAEHR